MWKIKPYDFYALPAHDKHYIRASEDKDLALICVFNPPLKGTETHNLNDPNGSSFWISLLLKIYEYICVMYYIINKFSIYIIVIY